MLEHLFISQSWRLDGGPGINHLIRGAGLAGGVIRYLLSNRGALTTGGVELCGFSVANGPVIALGWRVTDLIEADAKLVLGQVHVQSQAWREALGGNYKRV